MAFSGSRSITVSLFPSRCSRKHPQRFPALSLMIILGRYEKRLLRSISFPQKLFGGRCIHTGPMFGSLNPCWMSYDHHRRSEQVRSWDCVSRNEQTTSRSHNSHWETDSQNYQWSAVCDNGNLAPVAACQPSHAMWNLAQRRGRSASVNPGPWHSIQDILGQYKHKSWPVQGTTVFREYSFSELLGLGKSS